MGTLTEIFGRSITNFIFETMLTSHPWLTATVVLGGLTLYVCTKTYCD